MEIINRERGFVTIATGSDKYYDLAKTLLKSYRCFANDQLPFAIICDKWCEQVAEFDDVVILDTAHGSYMDKLELYQNSPYNETIFIDADALFLSDPGQLWKDFSLMQDFSCYGKTIPLESSEGWFDYKQTGEYRMLLKYGVQMHGGLYYFRKTDLCYEIFKRAKNLAAHYSEYKFAHFSNPADEPVLALSMAVSNCHPCEADERIVFLLSYEGRLKISRAGQLSIDKKESKAVVLHFGTENTKRFLYKYLVALIEQKIDCDVIPLTRRHFWKLKLQCLWAEIKIPNLRRLKKLIKRSVSPKTYQILRTWFRKIKRK